MVNNLFKNQRGYSLIELLTVIAIIGIVATIAIPYYRGYRDKAVMATIQSTLRQIRLVEEVYIVEKGNYYPTDAPLVFQNGQIVTIEEVDLSLYSPRGQIYTIFATEDADTVTYTVKIETNIDLNMNGLKDIYTFSRTLNQEDNSVVESEIMPLRPTLGS